MTLLQKLIASLGGIAIASGFGSWAAIAAGLPQPKSNQIAPQTGPSASEATPTTPDDLFNRGALRITTYRVHTSPSRLDLRLLGEC